jgi:transmembrane sensor
MASEEIEVQAADWLARLDRGDVSADVQHEFQAWCAADSRHYAAYLRLQHVWGRLERLRALHRQDGSAAELTDSKPTHMEPSTGAEPVVAAQPPPQQRAGRNRVPVYLVSGLAAALLLAIGGPWFWQHRGSYFTVATRYVTPLGGFQRVTLADGSIVQINTDSEVRVVLRKVERDIELVRGEASFEVAPDASRPFIVTVDGTAVRAVGTSFNVHKIPAGLEVMIVEGAVAVGPSTAMHKPEKLPVLSAGRYAIARAEQLEVKDIGGDEVARRLAWQRGMLGFNGQTLAEVVTEFNRYNEKKLRIEEPTIGQLRIGGYFRATNVEAFVRAIEERFGVSATRQPDRIVLRRAPRH